jgi:hypothetical protein
MREIIPSFAKILNSETGEIETVTAEIIRNKTRTKRGWNRMYRFAYDDVMREITSKLEMDIFIDIRESNLKGTFILDFNQQKLAKKHKTSYMTVSRVVNKLKKTNFVKKQGNVFYLNPFIYIPPNITDDIVEKFQIEWNTLEDKNE